MNVYAGLDLGGSSLKFGIGNRTEGLINFRTIKHQNSGREEIYGLLKRAVSEILDNCSEKYILKAIALGSPGYIDNFNGEILYNSPNLKGWVGSNPVNYLAQQFKLPVFIENDANLMAFGESKVARRDRGSLLGITIGTGIGSGFVHDNRIYHGSFSAALELGHTIIEPDGKRCACGKSGCLEAYAAIPPLEEEAGSITGKKRNIDYILEVYKTDSDIARIINKAYDRIGLVIANTVTILDPGYVVIGGGLTECPAFNIQPLSNSLKKYLNRYQSNHVQIERATLKNRAGVWGAVNLAEKSFDE